MSHEVAESVVAVHIGWFSNECRKTNSNVVALNKLQEEQTTQ